MSSLHPDRLPTGSPAPDQGTPPTPAAAPGTTSRRATGTATETTSSTPRPTQRRGSLPTAPARRARTVRAVTVTAARTATRTAARTASATAKATAKAAATGARAATSRAAKGTKPAPAKATKPAPARATKPTTAKPATAVRRPTPHPRAPEPVLELLPAAEPAVEDVVLPGDSRRSPAPGRPPRTRPPSVGSRPSLYLAAAVATVIGITGGLTSAGPAAQAGTRTVGATISVAERLGIPEQAAAPIVDAQATDRLGELVATRAERDAEQVAAAQVQATADLAAAEAARLAAEAAAEAARPDAVLPVEGARLTSGFGPRWGTLHAGIDLAAPMRTPEFAVMDGIVLEAGPASGYGLAVYVQHQNGDVTVYGHMDEILVSAGQVVAAGDTIALLGNTGQSTGPHLHFEVHQGGLQGTKIDPVPWLAERGVHV